MLKYICFAKCCKRKLRYIVMYYIICYIYIYADMYMLRQVMQKEAPNRQVQVCWKDQVIKS